ncbi:MAG: caspase family protein [Candidatus Acidiferrales bacterium]|jgi:WD40 repeat protein
MRKILHRVILILFGLGVCVSAWAQKPELVVETGHSMFILSMAFSPDSRILASGAADGTIKLWDLATGHELRSLATHGGILTVAFSPDGRTLASSGTKITLWDVATGQELRSMNVNSESIAFSPDGRTLATGNYDHSVKLWDEATGQELRTLTGHTNIVHFVSFSPDGRTLVSSSFDKTIKMWDAATGKELRTLTGHADNVWSVPFSPDGSALASASGDGTIKIWDAATGQEIGTLLRTGHMLMSADFSPDGKVLAVGGDHTIRLLDLTTGGDLLQLAGDDLGATAVAFSPDGRTLAAGAGNKIRCWDVKTGHEIQSLGGHTGGVYSVSFIHDGRELATASFGTIKIWDLVNGHASQTVSSPDGSTVFVSPDGQIVASSPRGKAIKLLDVPTGHELRTLEASPVNTLALAFSPDGRTVAAGGGPDPDTGVGDFTIKVWDVPTGRPLRSLVGNTSEVFSLAFSPDGRILASGGSYNYASHTSDETVKLWDVATGQILHTLAGYSGLIDAIAFGPDGRIVAAGGGGTVNLWDVATGAELHKLAGQVEKCLAFSPDGRTIASGSGSKIKLWDVATGRELRTFTGHTGRVWSVRFSPDGRTLASGGSEGATRIWDVASGKELGGLVSLDERDWAVVTPDGVFDASPGGMKLMHWTVGNEIITLDQLKSRYWEPGLLAKVSGFNKEPVRDVSAFNSVNLFPAVQFEAPARGSKQLKLELKNRGGGIGEVEVLVNGKEVVGDARGSSINPNASEASLTVDLSGSDYEPGKPNEIRVVTRNLEGYLASRGVEAEWTPEGKQDDSPPELWAIVGGISTYASPDVKLRYAAKDAVDMARALQLSAQKLFGADKVHLTLLTTEESPNGIAPTRGNFEKAFQQARKAKPQDILLVYLAGHGVALHGDTDLYAYLTADARSASMSDLSDPALRAQWTITSDTLTDWIKQIPALKQVMILDTCEAGAAKTKLVEKRDVPADQVRALDRMKDRTGFHVLMGAAVDKPSYEASNYSQGLLTYALLLGMEGAALRNGKFVDVSQWFQYAANEVPELARSIGQSQNPIVAAPSGTSFDVGDVDDSVRSVIHLVKAKPFLLRPMLLDLEQQGDELGLSTALRKRLDDESYALTRGTEAPLQAVFVDSDELPGAIRVGGTYTVKDSTVAVTLSLWRDKQKLETLQVRGHTENLQGLIQSLVVAIEGALLQLPNAK